MQRPLFTLRLIIAYLNNVVLTVCTIAQCSLQLTGCDVFPHTYCASLIHSHIVAHSGTLRQVDPEALCKLHTAYPLTVCVLIKIIAHMQIAAIIDGHITAHDQIRVYLHRAIHSHRGADVHIPPY